MCVCVSAVTWSVSERVQALELWGGDKPLRTGKLTSCVCCVMGWSVGFHLVACQQQSTSSHG